MEQKTEKVERSKPTSTVMHIFQVRSLRNEKLKKLRFKPTSISGPIASVGVRMSITSQESLHFAGALTRRQQAVRFLNKKHHDQAYMMTSKLFLFFSSSGFLHNPSIILTTMHFC